MDTKQNGFLGKNVVWMQTGGKIFLDRESVQHFIEDCELYDDIRERLRMRLFYSCGIKDFSAKTLLDVSKDNPL